MSREADLVIKAILAKEHPQSVLLSLGDFQRYAEERGVSTTSLEREHFELWDRVGLLRPVIKVRSVRSVHKVLGRRPGALQYDLNPLCRRPRRGEEVTVLYDHWYLEPNLIAALRQEPERIIDPYSSHFQRWKNFEDRQGQTRVTYWYHPFQLFRLREILKRLQLTVTFGGLRVFSVDPTIRRAYRNFAAIRRSFQNSEPEFLRSIALFVSIEDRFLPPLRQQLKFRGDRGGWERAGTEFNAQAVLNACGLGINDVRRLRRNLCWEWHWTNEIGDWHVLVRAALHDTRRHLRGKARLAWEYFEASEVLRLFLERFSGKPELGIEEIVSVGGSLLRSERPTAQRALRSMGVDPRPQVYLLVEGESEEEFIKQWCSLNRIDLGSAGVRLRPIFGINNLRTADRILREAKADEAAVILIVDDENDARDRLLELTAQHLIDCVHDEKSLDDPYRGVAGAHICKPCFEDYNFTLEELAQAMLSVAQKNIHGATLPDVPTLIAKANQHASAGMTKIQRLRRIAGKRLQCSKPELAAELARTCNRDVPIVKLLKKIFA